MIGQEELGTRFTYHAPHGDQVERYQDIREHAKAFATLIDRHCPDSREKALALTELESSVMWANAGIARRDPQEA